MLFLVTQSVQALFSSGVTSAMSAMVKLVRTSGGVTCGMGWVGEVTSPGTLLAGNRCSFTGKIGLPVVRSKMNTRLFFDTTATAGMVRPRFFTSNSNGGACRSLSQISWWTI